MRVRLILFAATSALFHRVQAAHPLINYRRFFLLSVGLETLGFSAVHVYPDKGYTSLQKCGNDFITFLISRNHELADFEADFRPEYTENDGTLNRDETGTRDRQKISMVPRMNIELLNTRIQTGLVVFTQDRGPKTAHLSKPMEGVEKKISTNYPLTVINIHVPQYAEQNKFQKDQNVFNTSQRQKKSGVNEYFQNKYQRDVTPFPWRTVWMLQEFRAVNGPSNYINKRSGFSKDLEAPRHEAKKRPEEHDLAAVPWQTLWLLQSERTECSFPGKVLRIGSSLKNIEMNEWLRPNPEESLGNCPIRFRPLVDPSRWLPRNLVETECVCEGSPCARLGLHVCVTVYAARTVYSLRGGKRRLLIAVGCLCAIQKTRLAKSVVPKTVD